MKEYCIIVWPAGANADVIAKTLNDGWDIMRADACATYLVYVLSRNKPEKENPESTVNRVTNDEVVGKKKPK